MSKPLILPAFRRIVGDAEEFAHTVHAVRADEAGNPLISHLTRVSGRTSAKLAGLPGVLSPVAICEMLQIAWLHHVIRDTSYGSNHLRAEGFSERVVHGVYALSNVAGTPYPDFIAGLVAHAALPVLLVKLSDNEDNADPERLAKLDEATRTRLWTKYEPSMAMLREAAQVKGWRG